MWDLLVVPLLPWASWLGWVIGWLMGPCDLPESPHIFQKKNGPRKQATPLQVFSMMW